MVQKSSKIIPLIFITCCAVGILYWLEVYIKIEKMMSFTKVKTEDVLEVLEADFNLRLPKEHIYNVHAASHRTMDGLLTCILRFTTDPNTYNQLIKPLSKVSEKTKYRKEADIRLGIRKPNWFKDAIEEGEIISYNSNNGKLEIYTDTKNNKHYIVYIFCGI